MTTAISETKKWPLAGQNDTPYKRAQQAWDERMGLALHSAKQWRRVAYFSLAMALASIIGMVYYSTLPRAVPHIVEIGPDDAPRYRGALGQSWEAYKPSDATTRYFLRQFIENIRALPSDQELVAQNWRQAYGFVTPQAAKILETMGKSNPPLQRVERERVGIEFKTVIPLSPSKKTWEIDWIEKTWDVRGLFIGQKTLRATITIDHHKPTDPDKIEKNPIGLYVDSLHIAEIRA